MKRWLTFHDAAVECQRTESDTNKQAFGEELARRFGLERARSVCYGPDFAVRFCFSNDAGFSNTVISLATLMKFDDRPFLVCLLKPNGVVTLIANTSFIKKVSHSSQRLSLTSIRGSILGHDIARECNGFPNVPRNFEALYDWHLGLHSKENLERIVAETTAIVPTGVRFEPTDMEIAKILDAPRRSLAAEHSGRLKEVDEALSSILRERASAILEIASVNNVNIRGSEIEQLFTGGHNSHGVADLAFDATENTRVLVDVKCKLLDLNSNPKLYNIDKMLRVLAEASSLLCLYLVGVDRRSEVVCGCLVDVLDAEVIARTRIQFHWAGRNSRGVTQLRAGPRVFFDPGFRRSVDPQSAAAFLVRMLDHTHLDIDR